VVYPHIYFSHKGLKMFQHFVFSGGGIKAVAYIGLLDVLKDYNLIHYNPVFHSVSMASIVTTLYQNYGNETLNIFKSIPFKDIQLRPSPKGLYSVNKLHKSMENSKVFTKKVKTENIVFSMKDNDGNFISHIEKELRLIDLICNTITIPYLVKPLSNLYDGGVVNNFPVENIPKNISDDSILMVDINSRGGIIRSLINQKSVCTKYRMSNYLDIPNKEKFDNQSIFNGILKNKKDLNNIIDFNYNFGRSLAYYILDDLNFFRR
jgi:hypothetical protein